MCNHLLPCQFFFCALGLSAVRVVAMRAPELNQPIPCPLLQTRTLPWPR